MTPTATTTPSSSAYRGVNRRVPTRRVRWSRGEKPRHVLEAMLDILEQQLAGRPWAVQPLSKRHHIQLVKRYIPDLTTVGEMTEERAMQVYREMRRRVEEDGREGRTEAKQATPYEPTLDFEAADRREERVFRILLALLSGPSAVGLSASDAVSYARHVLRTFEETAP